ncbi:MAG TPA: hypothetical protein DF699_05560 [Phycisphaerales bacterium]|nr:hypothetical protein [Phycisphaerales bacterium]
MALFDRSLFASFRPMLLSGVGAVASIVGSAQATWSILIVDTRTGEIVIGSATCVESIDLRRETPVLISGVGAVTAQSAVDSTGMNRQLIRDRLLQGVPLEAILDELEMSDDGHDNRQYGMISTAGETLTYSGIENADWAGGMTGRIERGTPGPQQDIVYAVQGNILSGSNVVQAAVDAIVASDGDLPAMMMAGMQAAKSAGGDGRCSCNSTDPTGCGSPPPEPFKSAHVGYMLGTRAGDTDAIRAIYPTDEFIGDIATLDLDGDGFEEVIVGSASSDEILIYKNTAMPGDPLSTLQLWQTLTGPASETVAMDVYASKLMVAFANPPRMALYQPDQTGSIELLDAVDLAGTPVGFASGLFDPEIQGVSLENTDEIQFFRGFTNEIELTNTLTLDFVPGQIALDRLNADGYNDLVVVDPANNMVYLYDGGEDGFARSESISTGTDPVHVRTADMNLDGDNEIIVQCGSSRRVEVYTLEKEQWVLWGSVTTAATGLAFDVADMSGDEYPDIVTTGLATNRNLQLFISDGLGGFTMQTRTRVGFSARSVLLRDMNNSGDLDIVVGTGGSDGLMVLDNPGEHDLPQPGQFAAGDYFMARNVANQRDDDPDPVDQLQALYDEWLVSRAGRVDAVRSNVFGNGLLVPGYTTRHWVELRDLEGELLEISDPSMVTVETGGVATASPVASDSPGRFHFDLEGGDETGVYSISVSVEDSTGRVELMPRPRLVITESAADLNADGQCNYFDVAIFLEAMSTLSPYADITGDGMTNFHDVATFIQEYAACNP